MLKITGLTIWPDKWNVSNAIYRHMEWKWAEHEERQGNCEQLSSREIKIQINGEQLEEVECRTKLLRRSQTSTGCCRDVKDKAGMENQEHFHSNWDQAKQEHCAGYTDRSTERSTENWIISACRHHRAESTRIWVEVPSANLDNIIQRPSTT